MTRVLVRRTGHLRFIALLPVIALVGCVQAPKPLYHWEGYSRTVYDQLLGTAASPAERASQLEAQAQKAAAANAALPPGFRANLGYLYLQLGRLDEARSQFAAEKAAFPESTAFMDFLITRMGAPAK